MSPLPQLSDIEAARTRLAPYLQVTPLTRAASLSEELQRDIFLKWDNKLRTGSFKERGALNFLLSLDKAALARGVCTASAGNHALGLSFHAQRLSVPCHIVMPINAPIVKSQSCRAFGAEVDHRRHEAADFAAGNGTMIECDGKRYDSMHRRLAIEGDDFIADAAGADDGHRRRQHDG